MRVSACAAQDGSLRPCSHAWSVRFEMLSADSSYDCERPVLRRAWRTSLAWTSVAQAKSRAFISRTDCRSLMPSSFPRVADDLAVRAVIVKLLANVLRDVACQVVLCGLRIHQQHAQLSGFNLWTELTRTLLCKSTTVPNIHRRDSSRSTTRGSLDRALRTLLHRSLRFEARE